jgi:hypothetical protein
MWIAFRHILDCAQRHIRIDATPSSRHAGSHCVVSRIKQEIYFAIR